MGGNDGNYSIGRSSTRLSKSESHSGPQTMSLPTRKTWQSSFIPLGTAGAERGAVIGQGGAGQGPLILRKSNAVQQRLLSQIR